MSREVTTLGHIVDARNDDARFRISHLYAVLRRLLRLTSPLSGRVEMRKNKGKEEEEKRFRDKERENKMRERPTEQACAVANEREYAVAVYFGTTEERRCLSLPFPSAAAPP